MMLWAVQEGYGPDVLGPIPGFLSEDDPRPAAEQIAENYCGGWDSFKGFTLGSDETLLYPGDPPLKPIAVTRLRSELIVLYEHAFLRIEQPDGSFDVARIDLTWSTTSTARLL